MLPDGMDANLRFYRNEIRFRPDGMLANSFLINKHIFNCFLLLNETLDFDQIHYLKNVSTNNNTNIVQLNLRIQRFDI